MGGWRVCGWKGGVRSGCGRPISGGGRPGAFEERGIRGGMAPPSGGEIGAWDGRDEEMMMALDARCGLFARQLFVFAPLP